MYDYDSCVVVRFRSGANLEGKYLSVIDILSRYLLGETEKNCHPDSRCPVRQSIQIPEV